MCQLLETIKLENGTLQNMEYHNGRFNKARFDLFGIKEEIKLEYFIRVPENCVIGVFRCRVIYSAQILKVEFFKYEQRKLQSFKVVIDDEIEYAYKYANRERLNALFDRKGECDEIIIVKNGLVTDCSIGNLVFFDGETWWTPSKPLLKGTKRMQLLDQAKIGEREIRIEDINQYLKIGMINVFFELENMPVISIENCLG